MRKIYLLFLPVLFSFAAISQTVKSKDGVILGNRQEFISSCIGATQKKQLEVAGFEVEAKRYCTCVCDKLLPNLKSYEIEAAMQNNRFNELIARQDNMEILLKCLDGNYQLGKDYKYTRDSEYGDLQKEYGIRNCIQGVLEADGDNKLWNSETAKEYCECAIDKMMGAGYTYGQIMEIENQNSTAFNEIAVPCVAEVMNRLKSQGSENVYIGADIVGNSDCTLVPMIDYFGNGYKIKITIGGIEKYFLFDTGASDMIIDREMEQSLLANGTLKETDYLGKTQYSMADNRTVDAQKIKVSNISIGDYVVSNTILAVIDKGSLLCGQSFLDKFRTWQIDHKKKELILYR